MLDYKVNLWFLVLMVNAINVKSESANGFSFDIEKCYNFSLCILQIIPRTHAADDNGGLLGIL